MSPFHSSATAHIGGLLSTWCRLPTCLCLYLTIPPVAPSSTPVHLHDCSPVHLVVSSPAATWFVTCCPYCPVSNVHPLKSPTTHQLSTSSPAATWFVTCCPYCPVSILLKAQPPTSCPPPLLPQPLVQLFQCLNSQFPISSANLSLWKLS